MSGKNTVSVRVVARKREVTGIVSITLERVAGGDLPEFTAGAHIDLHLPGNIVRQYSICSDSKNLGFYRIAVLLNAQTRGGSRAVHALVPGQLIDISEPRNHFPLDEETRKAVLIAGGIGVTPILAMAQTLHRQQTPFEFHYLSRSRSQTAFRREIALAPFGDQVDFRHDDDAGLITEVELCRRIGPPCAGRHLYMCGPEPLIAACRAAADKLGWPSQQVHFERFAPVDAPVKGEPLELHLARTGRSVPVGADQTLAQALKAAGVSVALSCEQGICGTCVVPVLDGVPDHRDCVLSEAEREAGKAIALCCSRAHGPSLTLDL